MVPRTRKVANKRAEVRLREAAKIINDQFSGCDYKPCDYAGLVTNLMLATVLNELNDTIIDLRNVIKNSNHANQNHGGDQ